MIKYYSITKQDTQRLRNVCEKIYLDREKLYGKLISWEAFTSDWLWYDLPETELDNEEWKKHRYHWKNSINDEFLRSKRSCELFVVRGRGVQLLADKLASHRYVSDRMKSYNNNTKNTISGCEERAVSNPESRKLLKRMKKMYEGFAYQAIGAIDVSKLPADLKTEWKLMFKKSIPKDED